MARVNEGSHSFACHPHIYPQVEWTIPAFTPQPQSITAFWLVLISCPAEGRRLSLPGWLGEILRWFFPPKMVTHPSTNRARRRVTSLIHPTMLPLRHIATQQSTIRKTCPCNMVNFSPLAANIVWRVWGTAANSTGFTSLVPRCRSTEVNQTLLDVWLSDWPVRYIIYIIGGSCPLTEFCQVQNSLCVQVLHSHTVAALLQDICSTAFHRGRHLYLEGGHHVWHRPTF